MSLEIYFVDVVKLGPPAVAICLAYDNAFGDESFVVSYLVLANATGADPLRKKAFVARNQVIPHKQLMPLSKALIEDLTRQAVGEVADHSSRVDSIQLRDFEPEVVSAYRSFGQYAQLDLLPGNSGQNELYEFLISVRGLRGMTPVG